MAVITLLESLGFTPYSVSLVILFFVSVFSFFGSLLGGFLFPALFGVVKKRLGLIWWDVMDERDIGQPIAGVLGAWLVTAGTLVGPAGAAVGFGGAPAGSVIGIIGLVLIIVGGILM